MKIGVSSYCYQPLLNKGAMSYFDVIEHAKKTGYNAIDFTDLKPPAGKSVNDFAGEIRAACEKAGLEIVAYTIGADLIHSNIEEEVKRLKSCVDTAKILGASMMRHDIVWNLSPEEKYPMLKNRTWREVISYIEKPVRELAEYAAGKGIKTMSENHGFVLQQSERAEKLVLAVNHPNYGALVDIGNFMCADEPGLHALPTMLPYAFHIHVKDFLYRSGKEERPDDSWFNTLQKNYLRGTVLGHGVVSVAQCIEVIKASGYNGCLTLEFEGLEEPLDAIKRGFDFIKRHI